MSDIPPLPEDKVTIACRELPDLDSPFCLLRDGCTTTNTARFDGAYIRRQRPYIARCIAQYRDGPFPLGTFCQVMVVEASSPGCGSIIFGGQSICSGSGTTPSSIGFTPTFTNVRSRLVRPPATSLLLLTGTQTAPDGTRRQVSYVDVPLDPPDVPTAVGVLFQITYNGITRTFGPQYVVFANILQLNLRPQTPRADCINPAEQFAEVNIINPDTGEIGALLGEVPVRWEIRKSGRTLERPFYSTDSIDAGNEIYSYSRNGLAKNVFFGPACSVSWSQQVRCPGEIINIPEVYAIKASVVYDDLSATDEKTITLRPFEPPQERGAAHFLLEFDTYLKRIYADGYDYIEGRIIHDPNNTESSFSRCFRDCLNLKNEIVVPLTGGQIVSIESGDEFEIIYGDDVVVSFDQIIQEAVITGGRRSIGFAEIPLSITSNITKFYLRLYKNIGYFADTTRPGEQADPITQCSCIRVSANLLDKRRKQLRARTTVLYNNETVQLDGGGSFSDGIPPTEIEIVEPLVIGYRGIKRNGEFVTNFLCDGLSVHELVFTVGFKGNAVPDGTAVFITLGGRNVEKIAVASSTVFTFTENGLSYAIVQLYPIISTDDFEVSVQAECRFDKRGEITRSATQCVTITYQDKEVVKPDDKPDGPVKEIDDAYENELHVYDTIEKYWEIRKGPQLARACLSLTWAFDSYNEYLYAIGGMNNNEILTLNERYDISENTWTQVTSMKTARFHHLSVFDGNYIYVFGGLTVANQALTLANKVERYNVFEDTWEEIGEMPKFDADSYTTALSKGVVVGNKFYIIGGIRAVGNAGLIDTLNDRVLIYDFDTNEWDYSEPYTGVDFSLYARVSPFAFVNMNANKIHVCGGANIDRAKQGEQAQKLIFPTDSFYIDVNDLSLHIDDNLYTQLPKLRYKGESLSVMNEHYFLGGSSALSNVSRTFEVLQEDQNIFQYSKLEDFSKGITCFGAASDDWRYLYVCSGLNSGRPPGFLQILADINPNEIKLDGKQTAVLKITLLDDVNQPPTKSVRVLVQGILNFLDTERESNNQSDTQQSQSSDSALKEALVYPVLFTSNDFIIESGVGSTILKPRSDDILAKVSEIRRALELQTVAGEGGENNGIKLTLRTGQTIFPYEIKIRITVLDSFYYGQTVLDVQDNTTDINTNDQTDVNPDVIDPTGPNDPTDVDPTGGGTPPPTGGETPTGGDSPPSQVGENFVGCAGITANEISDFTPPPPTIQPDVGNQNDNDFTIQPSLQLQGSVVFTLSPPQTPQLASPVVSYYNDEIWLPIVKILAQEGSYTEVIKELNILQNDIPYGASPIYDAIVMGAEMQTTDRYDLLGKSFYINTDNEESFSLYSLNEALASVQTIDGFGQVPAIISNFSVVFPLTLSALLARTDTTKLEKIAVETRGESQTIIDQDSFDIVFNNIVGRLQGGIGYGLFECTVDTDDINYVSSIKLDFELYDNTDASWVYATSNDGYFYSQFSEAFATNEIATLPNVSAKSIKFKVNLISGLSASISEEYDNIPTAGAPALTQISISYNIPTIKYLYLDIRDRELKSAQQVVLSVSANLHKYSSIEAGVISDKSSDWNLYDTINKPAVAKYGKVFIPIRYKTDDLSTLDETLQRIDGYVYKAFYGPWDSNAFVRIYDEDKNLIAKDDYLEIADLGIIVFNAKKTEKYTISIENQSLLAVGIRFVNIDANDALEINSLGYLFNTNVFLPTPLSQKPPEIRNLNIVPGQVTPYDKIEITYQYFDFNNDRENESAAKIRWYINGNEIEFLRNLRTWNDINNEEDPLYKYAFTFGKDDVPANTNIKDYARNRNESILKVGDRIYFTMQVSDSNFLSNVAKSANRLVVASSPAFTNLQIKALLQNGRTSETLTSETNAVAEFNYFADTTGVVDFESEIIWYVNGFEFKRGLINKIVNGISNNRILIGERKNNILGLTFGNTLRVEIIPKAGALFGQTVVSADVTVGNVPPRVINVIVSPRTRVSPSTTLQLSYTFVDAESTENPATQNDQSTITWFRSTDETRPFISVAVLQNSRSVASTYLASGQRWRAVVTPFDGVGTGVDVASNTVTIS